MSQFPVPRGTVVGNRSVQDAVQAGLTDLLTELESAAEGWDEKTRQSTMDKAVERWEKIKYKVEAYGEYLGSEQDRLRDGIAAAREKLAARIAELKPAEPEPAAA